MPKKNKLLPFQLLFIYILSFVVLWEWLRPLPVITDTGNIYVFVIFSFLCFILLYIRTPIYVAFPITFLAMMYGLHEIFFEGSFFKEGFATFVWFIEDLMNNVKFLVNTDIQHLSFEFRSFLLFLVLAITSYLIHFWIHHLKKIFLFLIVTVFYVTVLDTFTDYDGKSAIVRLVIAGFFLLSLLFKMRLEEKEQIQYDEVGHAWANMLTIIIAVAALVGFFAPKYEPYWPDPIPVFRSIITGEYGTGTGSVKRTIGYGQNDEKLGGGFSFDNSIVFTAISTYDHYWRGESKEIYTGKGWESIEQEENRTFRYSHLYNEKVAVQLYERNVQTTETGTTITMADDARFSHFFYPGELKFVNEDLLVFDEKNNGHRYSIDYVSGKVTATALGNDDPLLLKEYTLNYHYPVFNIEALKKSSENDPEHVRAVYTQLPEIPERIGQLSLEITQQYENRYEKVKAIEGYFRKNGYKYETKNVAIPSQDEDYVDQFLFETKQGYCDNFSTSMIVMLRTLDIPARWVKGFTEGLVVDRIGGGKKVYQVTNANAHSWVEVYFPDVGWIPFEPTSGFSNSFQFIEAPIERPDAPNEHEPNQNEQQERPLDPENPFLPLEEDDDRYNQVGEKPKKSEELQTFTFPFKYLVYIVVVLFVVLYIRKHQHKVITIYFIYVYKLKRNKPETFRKAFERLLWLLEYNGYPRQDGETLREYAIRIDRQLSSKEMVELSLQYEKLYYGNAANKPCWKENSSTWERLVKKLSS